MGTSAYLNISLSQIQVFLTVAEYKNFTFAAQRLSLTQSAVSKTIATLEYVLNVKLFDRKKQLTLTPAGELLRHEWSFLIGAVEHSIDKALMLNEQQKDVLIIGKPNFIDANSILPVVSKFQQLHPEVELKFEDLELNMLLSQLQQGHFDVILSITNSEELLLALGARFAEISQPAPMMITIHKDNPLAQRSSLTIGDLKDEKFLAISAEAYHPYMILLNGVCQEYGFVPKVSAHFSNVPSLITTLLFTGKGVVLTNPFILGLNNPNLKHFPIAGLHTSIIAAWVDETRRKKPLLDNLLKALVASGGQGPVEEMA